MPAKLGSEYTDKHIIFSCSERQRQLALTMAAAMDMKISAFMRKLLDDEFARMSQQSLLQALNLEIPNTVEV